VVTVGCEVLTCCSSGRRTRPLRSERQLYRERVPQRTARVGNNTRVFWRRNDHRTHQWNRNDLRGHLRSRMLRHGFVWLTEFLILKIFARILLTLSVLKYRHSIDN